MTEKIPQGILMALLYNEEAYTLLKKCSSLKDMSAWNLYRKIHNYEPMNL